MKIVEQTSERLVLRARPVALVSMLMALGAMFVLLDFGMQSLLPEGAAGGPGLSGMRLLGLSALVPFGAALLVWREKRVEFDRGSGHVTLASRGMAGRRERVFPLATLDRATLATASLRGSGTAHRALLHFRDLPNPVPLTYFYTGGNGPARAVQAINLWLGHPLAPDADPVSG